MAGATEAAVSAWWPRPLVAAVDSLNRRGGAVAVRLVKYTGKSREAIHPKHLVDAPWHHWYVDYLQAGDVVLDVGCANGAHTLAAAGRVRTSRSSASRWRPRAGAGWTTYGCWRGT